MRPSGPGVRKGQPATRVSLKPAHPVTVRPIGRLPTQPDGRAGPPNLRAVASAFVEGIDLEGLLGGAHAVTGTGDAAGAGGMGPLSPSGPARRRHSGQGVGT